ncbi:MAG: hypothetical protein JRH11_22105 [Deltaproteobacteria bacterium]|nr:hypothetical protein [Deltaproteobacteria bacterium]
MKGADPDAEAFARVLSFSVAKERLPEVRERIYQVLHDEVFAADAAADGVDEGVVQASVVLGLVETPTGRAWRARK